MSQIQHRGRETTPPTAWS